MLIEKVPGSLDIWLTSCGQKLDFQPVTRALSRRSEPLQDMESGTFSLTPSLCTTLHMISKTVCFLRTWLVVTGRIGPASLNVDNAMVIDTEKMREYKGGGPMGFTAQFKRKSQPWPVIRSMSVQVK
jgi:hypothetical protein